MNSVDFLEVDPGAAKGQDNAPLRMVGRGQEIRTTLTRNVEDDSE